MKKLLLRTFRIAAASLLLFNLLALFWVILYAWIPVPVTKLMVIEGKNQEIHYKWKDLDQLSGKLQLAVMCAEDQNFLLHRGLDFKSIRLTRNAIIGRKSKKSGNFLF